MVGVAAELSFAFHAIPSLSYRNNIAPGVGGAEMEGVEGWKMEMGR